MRVLRALASVAFSDGAGIPDRFDRLWFYRTAAEKALGPFLKTLGRRRAPVFFIPHGELAGLPWQALRVDGEPILARFPIRYLPHAGILEGGQWPRGSSEPPDGTGIGTTVVLADPTGDLPGARAEGEAIANSLRITAKCGAQATRSAFVSGLLSADVLHFAGHGSIDQNDPLNSGLVMADGRFTARDLRGFQSRARVVVLNACESGVHSVGIGSELQGFVRALLLAGVDIIICAQWRIDDTVAKEFALLFYQNLLAESTSPAEAAWKAQLTLLRHYENRAELWSPFIVVG